MSGERQEHDWDPSTYRCKRCGITHELIALCVGTTTERLSRTCLDWLRYTPIDPSGSKIRFLGSAE